MLLVALVATMLACMVPVTTAQSYNADHERCEPPPARPQTAPVHTRDTHTHGLAGSALAPLPRAHSQEYTHIQRPPSSNNSNSANSEFQAQIDKEKKDYQRSRALTARHLPPTTSL